MDTRNIANAAECGSGDLHPDEAPMQPPQQRKPRYRQGGNGGEVRNAAVAASARPCAVRFPYPAKPGARVRFWSMAYRDEFIEQAFATLGLGGFVLLALGQCAGVL